MALGCVLASATSAASVGAAPTRDTSSFPCRWKWDLEAGLRDGYVTAGNSADCGGRRGSLTLSVRLFKWDPATKTWRTEKAQTKTFRNLNGNRYLELAEPCTSSTVRAVFGWILRDTGGTIVSRNTVKTKSLRVPGPGCRISLGP